MHSQFPRIESKQRSRAFTLVEMLVVIAIMSILMTAGAIGLGGMGGKGVTSGVATAESLFAEARAIAVGQRTRTRVLIAMDLPNSPSDNLRRIVVASETSDSAGLPSGNWTLTSRGALLPDQTFFSKTFSMSDHARQLGFGVTSEMTLGSPTFKAGYIGKYIFYEFNAEGICNTPGASFVIGAGSRGGTAATQTGLPRVTASAKRDFGGFVVWRNGMTSIFRSPDQVSTGIRSLNSGAQF
jgi:prepilin-type N-terminal cleavage/methylation domain-containing protein